MFADKDLLPVQFQFLNFELCIDLRLLTSQLVKHVVILFHAVLSPFKIIMFIARKRTTIGASTLLSQMN